MPVLDSSLDPRSTFYVENSSAMQEHLADLDAALALARKGGGDKYVTRHHARGKLLARERIELLVDRDTPFLELCPFAGYGSHYPVGGSVVIGIGQVEGSLCVVVANDPTVRDGAINPYSLKKILRAAQIARANRLPLINLIESGGADLPAQAEIFVPGGEVYRDLARLSADGVPTVAVVFGDATGVGAYLPGMCDYTVLVKDRAKVVVAGPPLVEMVTGELTDDESLGGAAMHGVRSGLADFIADDERDAIRLARTCIARGAAPISSPPPALAEPPKFDPEDLLGVVPADPGAAFDPREVLARVLDGSGFDEFKPAYGTALCTGWGTVHGYRVGVLANARAVLSSPEALKAVQFIQLANSTGIPLVFLQNTTGFQLGTEHEQTGSVKHGAMMIRAVANSTVPHITITMGASYGAGNYGMCGRAHEPRFLFSWPNARTALMGPRQLAGTLSIVARQAAEAKGQPYDEVADATARVAVSEQIDEESTALSMSGRLLDDGVIDPRDTRTVLGMCLAAARRQAEPAGYGVFRM
jgi:acetyl-CoA carboxylase carboxyltransferase component